ncbi:transcription factor E2F1 isoform X2 [Channa argus]|uniref:transcription factor E2F1 isoform X2 n=1 Tax=Channa argus TaxID=215402 RepID=UPI003521C6BA
MVKCVVSGCPNRVGHRGIFNRAPKRFFHFPKDPARVKIWLAALRETDKQDSTEQHLICEDHFLPEHIAKNDVKSDAIPIMPQCPDGSLGMISSWGAEASEDEEENPWADGDGEEEDDAVDDAHRNDLVVMEDSAPEAPAVDPLKQDPDADTSVDKTTSNGPCEPQETSQTKKVTSRQDVSLWLLTRRFLDLLLTSPDGTLDLREVTASLQTRKRRVYDITNVLDGIKLIKKESANRIKWIGSSPISSLLWNSHKFSGELDNLKLVEDTLDTLIKRCAQQLFDMTDDTENSAMAYVTHEDIDRLRAFQDQTVIVVKAPEETKLEVPAPTESRRVHRVRSRRFTIGRLQPSTSGFPIQVWNICRYQMG